MKLAGKIGNKSIQIKGDNGRSPYNMTVILGL